MSSKNISKLLYKQRVESRKSFSYNMSLSASCWSYEVCLKSNGTECAVWGIGERGISRLGYHIIWYFGVYNCNLSLEFVFFWVFFTCFCGKRNCGCFIMAMYLLTMSRASDSSRPRKTLYWNNLPIHLMLLQVTFSPGSRGSWLEHVLKPWRPSRGL